MWLKPAGTGLTRHFFLEVRLEGSFRAFTGTMVDRCKLVEKGRRRGSGPKADRKAAGHRRSSQQAARTQLHGGAKSHAELPIYGREQTQDGSISSQSLEDASEQPLTCEANLSSLQLSLPDESSQDPCEIVAGQGWQSSEAELPAKPSGIADGGGGAGAYRGALRSVMGRNALTIASVELELDRVSHYLSLLELPP